jgi:hypothetical protein
MNAAFLVKTTRTPDARVQGRADLATSHQWPAKKNRWLPIERKLINISRMLLALLLYIELSNEKLKLLLKQIRKRVDRPKLKNETRRTMPSGDGLPTTLDIFTRRLAAFVSMI